MIPFIPFGTTYNDMLVEFVSKCYVSDQYEQTVRTIKATFKKLTGYSINHLVDDYSYQEVIDKLSNAKIPHCCFADWLRKYEWKTPQQSENGEQGATSNDTAEAEITPGVYKASNIASWSGADLEQASLTAEPTASNSTTADPIDSLYTMWLYEITPRSARTNVLMAALYKHYKESQIELRSLKPTVTNLSS